MIEIHEIKDLDAVLPQLKNLHSAHWKETEKYRNSEFTPRYDLLDHYFKVGVLRIWGAFEYGVMVGHLSMYITTSLHTGEQIATEDALYVLEHYRTGVGARLSRTMLADLRAGGVAEVWATCKPATRVGLLLKRLGFNHVADTYHVRLKDNYVRTVASCNA